MNMMEHNKAMLALGNKKINDEDSVSIDGDSSHSSHSDRFYALNDVNNEYETVGKGKTVGNKVQKRDDNGSENDDVEQVNDE